MDLRQLRYFVSIIQTGSLSRAANLLHIAQSAVSHHLAGLEAELGKHLVTRGPKGVSLTDAGSVLYRHTEAILRHVEITKRDAIGALTIPSGPVSIGLPSVLAPNLGYELFDKLRTTFPQIHLQLVDGSSPLFRELLDNNRLDIAVLFADRPEHGLAVEPLLLEELFFVTSTSAITPVTLA